MMGLKKREELKFELGLGEKLDQHQEQQSKAEKIDLSGLFLDKLPSPSLNLAAITKLDLSNNNLEVTLDMGLSGIRKILFFLYMFLVF